MTGYGRTFPLWRIAAGEAWGAYTRHPLFEGLRDGTLPCAAYFRYLVQDYLFLVQFSRAWALGVAKGETLDEIRACAATMHARMNEEMRLHIETCAGAGLSEADLFAAEEASDNLAYTRFVLDAGHSGDFLDLLAALAPCVLGYGEIGARLAAEAGNPRYAPWIAVCSGATYQETCRAVGALIDGAVLCRIGPQPVRSARWPRLCHRFATATRLEIGFWSMGLEP